MCRCYEYAGGEFDERLRWVCPECEEKANLEERDYEESFYRCKCGAWKRIENNACEECLQDYAEAVCA